MRGTAPELQLHLASSRAAASPGSPRPVSSLAGADMDRKSKSAKGSASSAAASMAALAAAAAAGDSSADTGVEDNVPAKMAAVGDASSSSPVSARRGVAAAGGATSSSSPVPVAARRGAAAAAAAASVAAGGGGGGPRCQAERCNANLITDEKPYNRRHKVCEAHSKAPVVLVAGLRQRFCQQCSRFHELSEFDDIKRSCRLRLAGHNERRRKSSADPHGGGGGGSNGFRQHPDQNGPPGNHLQIR